MVNIVPNYRNLKLFPKFMLIMTAYIFGKRRTEKDNDESIVRMDILGWYSEKSHIT